MRDILTPHGLARSPFWVGEGRCQGHFGELLQGAFSRPEGGVVRGLVTLPCAGPQATAVVEVTPGAGAILAPEGCAKARRAVERYLRLHGLPRRFDIALRIESAIPVGVGMGSSTSDVVATVRALDRVFGYSSAGAAIARLCMECEAASDSVMFGRRAILFAQREGVVIEDYGVDFPALAVVGVDLEPGGGFDTDATPPARYAPGQIARFDALRAILRAAFARGDLAALGAVASESAEINQGFFPKRRFEELRAIASALGALGVSISHSGTIAGLLFAPADAEAVRRASAALDQNGFTLTGVHHVG